MPIEIRRATRDRLEHAAGVLGRALASEPMISWPFRGGEGPEPDRATALFRILMSPYLDSGVVWEDAEGRGCAAWIPPGRLDVFETTDVIARDAIAPVTDDGGARYAVFWDWIGEHMPEDPIWFLDMVGVDPPFQGRGIGTALIRHGVELSAQTGVPALLETATPRNVPYYERSGFRVVDEGDAPDGGPHVWFMRRDP
jgi:GNAT superfamily N-acetyltransferase